MPANTVRLRSQFLLDPTVAFLNHGAFGATPRAVLARRSDYQLACEANPVPALTTSYTPALDEARMTLATYVHGIPDSVAWCANATFGMNLVARSLASDLDPGDEVVVTDHEYGSFLQLWRWVCEARGARLVVARLPIPPPCDAESRADLILGAVTRNTRVLVVSHITSDTALRLPVERLAAAAKNLGVVTVVDGAHAPGQIELNLSQLRPDYYVADLHKWACAPRPTGFLYAERRAQRQLDPLIVSWGGTDRGAPLSQRQEFPGTSDPSNWLAVPDALAFHRQHLAPAATQARRMLAQLGEDLAALGYEAVSPEAEDGLLMRTWRLPRGKTADGLAARLRDRHNVETQVVEESPWGPLLRVSVAWYTEEQEIERLLVGMANELDNPTALKGE